MLHRHASWLVPVALVAATLAVFWPMLAHGFHSDDFQLVLLNRDLGFDGFLKFLFDGDYGDRPWVYWRPAWAATYWLLHEWFGAAAPAYMAFALAAHVVHVLVLYFVARAFSGSTVLALAAALWFSLHAAHDEAVLWFAAAANVIPAATLLLLAAALTRSFANGGHRLGLPAAFACAAASLAWKEAAYGYPFVVAFAWWSRGAGGRFAGRGLALAAATVAFAGVVASHYLLRNNTAGLAGSAVDILRVFVASQAGFLRALAPLPGGPFTLVGVLALVLVPVFWWARPVTRFWLVATLAGTLPYAFLTSSARFAYFFHGPLAVWLVVGLAGCLRVDRAAWRPVPVALALLATLWLAPGDIRSSIARWGGEAAQAERVVTALVDDGHTEGESLWVDVVPMSLINGLSGAIELRTGRRLAVSSLQAWPRPPFLIHIDTSGNSIPTGDTIMRFDAASDRYLPQPFGDRLAGLTPIPLFALCDRARVVADDAAALALLRSGEVDLVREAILFESPPTELTAGAKGSIRKLRSDIRDMGATVDCDGTMLFVVAFPVPVDFTADGGAILVDDQPVPVQRANVHFHAVVVPPGTHRIQLRPKF